MTRKNRYQAHIHEYKKRRAKLREQYPNWSKGNTLYAMKVARINRKIKNWTNRINRLELKEKGIWHINNMICSFLGLKTLRLTSAQGEPKKELKTTAKGRKLLCAYAIDNRLGGVALSSFLGCDNTSTYAARTKFKKSFKTNKANYELWQQFKLFVKDYEGKVFSIEQRKHAA